MKSRHHNECGCSHDAFEALNHIDAIICKVALIPEAKRISALEKRLYDVSMKEFEARSRPATRDLIRAIRDGKATDEDSTLVLMSDFGKRFEDLPSKLAPFYETAVEEAYRAGFVAIWKKAFDVYPKDRDITYPSPHKFARPSDEWLNREKAKPLPEIARVIPTFELVDEAAIETLRNHQVFWIGNHYDVELSDMIANATVDSMVREGFDRTEGANRVQGQLTKILDPRPGAFTTATVIPHGWKGSVAQYYEGLAANAMTVSRTFGAVSALRRLGAQTYTISNPMDERTCEVCAFIVDTSYATTDGAALMDGALAAASPEAVKEIIRWDGLKMIKERSGVTTAGAKASPEAARALAQNGYGLPSFHFRCRCVVDINDATSFGVPM